MYNQILKLFSCLEKNQKNKFLIFVIILFFASILEALGIGIIIPLISTILGSENTFINYLPYEIKQFLLSFEKISLIIFLSFLICFFFIFKNLILIIISFFQSRYVFGIKDSLEKKIFKSYLLQNYSNFMRINSSRRINNLIVETQNIVEGAIIPIMILVTELLVLLSISTLLLIYNFKITILSISVLLLITSLSIIFLKPLFKKWGEQRTKYNQQKAEILNQSIFGIREIKLFKMSKGTIETFNKFNRLLNNTSYKHIFLQSITKFYLEIGAIVSFVTVVIVFFKKQQ
jgi:ABC-type multidrug transport system fused ATPase/permease subunit